MMIMRMRMTTRKDPIKRIRDIKTEIRTEIRTEKKDHIRKDQKEDDTNRTLIEKEQIQMEIMSFITKRILYLFNTAFLKSLSLSPLKSWLLMMI